MKKKKELKELFFYTGILTLTISILLSHQGEVLAQEKEEVDSKNKPEQFIYPGHVGDPPKTSSPLEITELMPNPEGKDGKKEWIELKNNSKEKIILKNASIRINNKEKKLKNDYIIQSNQLITIDNSEEDFTLPNSQSKLEIIANNKALSKINYPDSKEGKSYAKLKIDNKEKTIKKVWLWIEPSKKSENPSLQIITGTLNQTPQIRKNYHFTIKNRENKIYKITFHENNFNFKYLKSILKQDQKIEVLVKNERNLNTLVDFKILGETKKTKQPEKINHKKIAKKTSAISCIGLLILTIFLKKSLQNS